MPSQNPNNNGYGSMNDYKRNNGMGANNIGKNNKDGGVSGSLKEAKHKQKKETIRKAIIETSKLNQTIHKIDVGIIVHIFTQRITAKADVNDNIPVQTKAKTNTDITFELCRIAVTKIQLQKDFRTDDVNFFIKFLNHQLENPATACSI